MFIHYLHAGTFPLEDYLDKNGWVPTERSDKVIEELMTPAQLDAGRRYNGKQNKQVSLFNLDSKLTNPVPCTEKTLEPKIARKVANRSTEVFLGFWDTLAPRSVVSRTSSKSTVFREPGVPEARVRKKNIAKFGAKIERNTPL